MRTLKICIEFSSLYSSKKHYYECSKAGYWNIIIIILFHCIISFILPTVPNISIKFLFHILEFCLYW